MLITFHSTVGRCVSSNRGLVNGLFGSNSVRVYIESVWYSGLFDSVSIQLCVILFYFKYIDIILAKLISIQFGSIGSNLFELEPDLNQLIWYRIN